LFSLYDEGKRTISLNPIRSREIVEYLNLYVYIVGNRSITIEVDEEVNEALVGCGVND